MTPKAPSWFRKMVREFDPNLRVRWNPGPERWAIYHLVPTTVYKGRWEGMNLYRRENIPHWVMDLPAIGTRVFDVLKRGQVQRYNDFNEYCREWKLNGYGTG